MSEVTDFTSVSAKVATEVLLGTIRLRPDQGEPRYIYRLREILKPMEKVVGKDGLNTAQEALRPALHILADALFDAAVDIHQPQTTEKLKRLPVPIRAAVEQIIAAMTGRKSEDRRWHNPLWELRKKLRQIADLSISGITLEEIRQGYDPLLHQVVDRLWDNWQRFVS